MREVPGGAAGQAMKINRVNILGVGISAVNMAQALDTIERWIEERRQHYVCVTPVSGVMACQGDEELKRIFNGSGLTTPDGMPMVWLSRMAGYRTVDRVYGPDLMLALCERMEQKGYSAYLYGGIDGVAERLSDRLRDRFPALKIAGTYSPPFRPLSSEEDERIVRAINAAEPDVVWVGISTPKQDRWMAEHLRRIDAPVMIGVGAAFDFLSGRIAQAPRWMQRSGLEWFFRLCTEPRRLWKRYLIQNPAFLFLVLLQLLGLRKYE